MIISQESKNGPDKNKIDFFRPNLSPKVPAGTAPIIAPMASKELTQDPWSSVIGSQESDLYNFGSTGDVQASAVPAPIANVHAVEQIIHEICSSRLISSEN